MNSLKVLSRPSLVVLAVVVASVPRLAGAQERPAPVAEVAAGTFDFPDNGTDRHGFLGCAVRFYVLHRISIGPEFAYVTGERRSRRMLTGNVTFDLVRPADGQARPFTPFAVVGGGLFQTREEFPREIYTSSEGAFTAGGGVRARITNRVGAGAEARVGWELHIRVNALVTVRLGG